MYTPSRTGFALLAIGLAVSTHADETALRLRDAPEAVNVRAYCSMCHSVDYIEMNAPFMKKAAWDAEVHKMIKVMGAPIPEDAVPPIVEYLTRYYGVD